MGRGRMVGGLGRLVLLGLDEVSVDHLYANRVQDEAITIAPHQYGCFLSDFQNTLRALLDGLWFERCATLYRHVDVRDRKFFSPHHGTSPKTPTRNPVTWDGSTLDRKARSR